MRDLQRDHHETILHAKPESYGFIVGKNWEDEDMCAAVPVIGSKKQLAIIQHGKVVKYCKNVLTARKFIDKLRKSK